MKYTFYSDSEKDTEQLGYRLAKMLKTGAFVAMYGDLGVGKTAFVRGMARYLAPAATVTSPSYSLCNTYRGEGVLHHLDLYRITSEDDLESIGFYDLLGEGIAVVEWCELIPAAVPEDALRVKISRVDGSADRRVIEIEGGEFDAGFGN